MAIQSHKIDAELAHGLIKAQFPQWAQLPVRPLAKSGMSNLSFHLGEQMVLRFPRTAHHAAQMETEFEWIPRISGHLPLPISRPIALGRPTEGFPLTWGVYGWIEGEVALPQNVCDMPLFAEDLAHFLKAMQALDACAGPPSGARNNYRGCSLTFYDEQSRKAIELLEGRIDTPLATELWETALASEWTRPPVWIHGDVGAENLLVQEGRLCGVIDFGCFGLGDPACDLAMCWNIFDDDSRRAFRSILSLDRETWERGRGWVLWKALIIASELCYANTHEASLAGQIIEKTLNDHRKEHG